MTKTLLIVALTLFAVPVSAQEIFRATPIDEAQNVRLDNLEAKFESLEDSIKNLTKSVEKNQMASIQLAASLTTQQPPSKTPPSEAKHDCMCSDDCTCGCDGKDGCSCSCSTSTASHDPTIYREVLVPVNTSYGSTGGSVNHEVFSQPMAPQTYAPNYGSSGGYATSSSSNGYYPSQSSLSAEIRRYRPSGSTRAVYAKVSASYAPRHLLEHGWSQSEINSLSSSEQIILHDLTHGGVLTPSKYRSRSRTTTVNYNQPTPLYNPPPVRSRQVTRSVSNYSPCANGQCATGYSTSTTRSSSGGLFGFGILGR